MNSGESAGDELASLRRCVRDLVGLLALPSMTQGRTPREVLETGLDALLAAVPAELAYASAILGDQETLVARRHGVGIAPAEIETTLRRALDAPLSTVVTLADDRRAIRLPLSVGNTGGTVLLATARRDFPTTEEHVLLRTATSLIAASLEHALLLAQARAADRAKDDFLALLGHELRNPLAPIVTALELIALKAPEVGRERAVIDRQVRHMIALVDDLLDLSRITRGKLEIREERVAIADVIARAVEMTQPLITQRRHALALHLEPDLHVRGDATRLAQVLANLLHNAARYTDPGGTLRVEATQDGSTVQIAVADDGSGIAADQLQSIWQPFVQAQRRTERSAGGLGLGLAIVKSLVEKHGGTVAVRSDGAGRGSTFVVRLPVARESVVPPDPRPPAARVRASGFVLVVDDNEDAAEMLRQVLEADGYEVVTAFDGPRALALAAARSPDLAVLDIGLPGMDGYELAGRLRALVPRTRLIALTGYGTDRDAERARSAGFDAHLVKPVERAKLRAALQPDEPTA